MGAKNQPERLMGWAEWIAVGAAAAIVLTIAAILSPGLRSFIVSTSTAAWVQAVGSISAIFVAIWVAHRHHVNDLKLQRKKADLDAQAKEEDERKEEARTLQAILDEIDVRMRQFEAIIGIKLDECKGKPQPIFDSYNRMPIDPFPVYRSLLPRLPLIQDTAVRRKIVQGYAVLESLVLTVETNSKFAEEYHSASADRQASNTNITATLEAAKKAQLAGYFRQLQMMTDVARSEAKELQELLRHKVDSVPSHEQRVLHVGHSE